MIGLFKRPQTNRKDNEKGMQFGCQQPLLLGGALRDSPKNGCEGDYQCPRASFVLKGSGNDCYAGYRNIYLFSFVSNHACFPSIQVGLNHLISNTSIQIIRYKYCTQEILSSSFYTAVTRDELIQLSRTGRKFTRAWRKASSSVFHSYTRKKKKKTLMIA